MRRSIKLYAGTIATLSALVFTTTACSGDTGAAPNEASTEALQDAPSPQQETDGNDRAFDASEDDVILTIETTFKSENAKAEWAGNTLRVSLDGSVDAPTASNPCLAVESLISNDEDVTLVYSNGEVVCADRP